LKRWLHERFKEIVVEPTCKTITILNNIKNKYEDHHNVMYIFKMLLRPVKLTDRYMSERLPDKAIDADEAGSRLFTS
jgi:ATP-dependent Clp protease ATP-binding subunit ClpC